MTEQCIKATMPITYQHPYFELKIELLETLTIQPVVAIGLAPADFPLNGALPGWISGSFGYHSDDGKYYGGLPIGSLAGPKVNVGQTMGCGVANDHIYFTIDGVVVYRTKEIPGQIFGHLFPVIGLDEAVVVCNFGNTAFKYTSQLQKL